MLDGYNNAILIARLKNLNGGLESIPVTNQTDDPIIPRIKYIIFKNIKSSLLEIAL